MSVVPPKYKDYYDLLGLSRDSPSLTPQKIKTAFMTKALQWHPDKASTPEDIPVYTKVYEDLQQAYKILSNEETRRQYTDAQQTTNFELTKQDRDLSYQKSDQYVKVTSQGYKFDRDTFVADFEMTRDKDDRKMLESLTERTKMPVTKTEFQQYLQSRDQDIEIPRLFKEEFDSGVFHQAFEYVKATQPSRGLEEYSGEPVAHGLAEIDDGFSGINFGNGLSFGSTAFQGVDIGVAFNPTTIDLGMFTNQPKQTEQKLSSRDIEARMRNIQADRDRLANIKPEEFSREPTEIERLYSGLFKQMTEELESKRMS
jgi:curved DNA-binding protein CbpA